MKLELGFAILCGTISTISLGQSNESIDSIVTVMCQEIELSQHLTDSSIVISMYADHLIPFLERLPELKVQETEEIVFYRLQRNCRAFSDALDRLDPPKESWVRVEKKPVISLHKNDCFMFPQHKVLKYVESNGDSVTLTIASGFWTDLFKDGTNSKLKFEWVTDCEFEIEFIQSNNKIRNQFSRKGDKYRYQIIDKDDETYTMSVQILGTETYYLFKMFYND